MGRALRRWLTDGRQRERLRQLALLRRDSLPGWDMTARRMRQALESA
jgi:hypothetical protein